MKPVCAVTHEAVRTRTTSLSDKPLSVNFRPLRIAPGVPVFTAARACRAARCPRRTCARRRSRSRASAAPGSALRADPVPADATLAELLCRHEPLVTPKSRASRANLTPPRHRRSFGARARFEDSAHRPASACARTARGTTARRRVILVAPGSSPLSPARRFRSTIPDVLDTDGILAAGRVPRLAHRHRRRRHRLRIRLDVRARSVCASCCSTRGERLLAVLPTPSCRGLLADSLAAGRRRGALRRKSRRTSSARRGGIVTRARRRRHASITEQVLVSARGGSATRLTSRSMPPASRPTRAVGCASTPSIRPTVPHIYAAGDVIGFPALASTSMEQARVAVCHAFGFDVQDGRCLHVLPFGIYTIPEVAWSAMSEESARRRRACDVGRRPRVLPRQRARQDRRRQGRRASSSSFARGDATAARVPLHRRARDRAGAHRVRRCLLLGGTIDDVHRDGLQLPDALRDVQVRRLRRARPEPNDPIVGSCPVNPI